MHIEPISSTLERFHRASLEEELGARTPSALGERGNHDVGDLDPQCCMRVKLVYD